MIENIDNEIDNFISQKIKNKRYISNYWNIFSMSNYSKWVIENKYDFIMKEIKTKTFIW